MTEKKTASLWSDAWKRFRRNRAAVVGLAIILFLVFTSVAAPLLTPYRPDKVDFDAVRQGPTLKHPMGTDLQGRDILCRMMYGGRASLSVGFISQFVVTLLGATIGAVAGYYGKLVDTLIMRLTDIVFAFPMSMFLIILMVLLGRGFGNLILAMTITAWAQPARLVRGTVLQLKEREFIVAAHSVGARDRDVIFRHLFPNLLGPLIVAFTLGIPGAITAEAGLSFMGMGLIPPTPSWGIMLNQGFEMFRASPHMVVFPAVTIAVVMTAFMMFGDGLQAAFDPHAMR